MASPLQNTYVIAALIFLLAVIIAHLGRYLLHRYASYKSTTNAAAANMIVKGVAGPLYASIIGIGLFLASNRLPFLAPYRTLVDTLFYIIGVLLGAYFVVTMVTVLVRRWLQVKKRFQKTPELLNKFIAAIIYIIAIIVILGHLQVEITPLVTALGLGGFAVGLALQSTLSNFFAGLHIISERPVNVGDYIELKQEQIEGYVDDVGWRSTRIRTLPNTMVIVPNATLAESVVINNSLPEQEMAVLVQVGVAYYSDLEHVERVTVEEAAKIQKEVEGAVTDFEPFIRFHTFGDSNIQFTVILRVTEFVNRYHVTNEFMKALKRRYDAEGIEISWPVRKVFYGDEPEEN